MLAMSVVESTWRAELQHCTRSLEELEAVAWQAWIGSGLAYALRVGMPHPRVLAEAMRVPLRPGHPPGTGGAALVGGVVVYRAGTESVVGLRITHELKHVAANRQLPGHVHGDVVALTLMSLYPATVLNVWAAERRLTIARVVRWQPHAPRWAAVMRLDLWSEQQPPALDAAIPFA